LFINLRDGTGLVQVVVALEDLGEEAFEQIANLSQESSLEIQGSIHQDERQIGGIEVKAEFAKPIGKSVDYPVSNKEHGVEFLMDHRHLWLRSRRQWAIMRIRNRIIMAIHEFFQDRGFIQMDAPLFTANACEGTSTLFETDFYGQPAYLSQSGQLYGEAMAMAMGKIYTFGPTFRAEKSKTRRHLSEFWMIEPEMAFYNLEMTLDVIEDFLHHVVESVLSKSKEELGVLGRNTKALEDSLKPFMRLTYHEAVDILRGKKEVNGKFSIDVLEEDLKEATTRNSEIEKEIQEREATIAGPGVKKGVRNFNQSKIQGLKKEQSEVEEQLRNIPQWIASAKNFKEGSDLGGSDETVITRMFDVPIMVYNWPHQVKAFYMKRDENNPELAKGVDVLAPEGYGEIVGGGERETNAQWLEEKIKEHNLPMKEFDWYLDLRKYGSVQHAGFGLGLERLVAWVCKLQHVRETIPFPRMYGRLAP
jgi:asparaginyl-tRNA synthetase